MKKAIRIVAYQRTAEYFGTRTAVIDQIFEMDLVYRKDGTIGKGLDKIVGELVEKMENGRLAKIELHLVDQK